MTDGTYTALDDATILALLLATDGDDTGDTDAPTDVADGDGRGPTERVPETSAEPANDSTTADSGVGDPDPDEASDESTPAAALSGPARGGIELRVRLSTLLGRDQHPAEIPGWGPVHAELARDLAATLARGQWHYAITDARGQLLHAGITRARPTDRSRAAGRRTRDVVELQIPATLLHELTQDTGLGPWAPVIADLAHQHTTTQGTERFTGDAARRHPSAALRRHLQIRDRVCLAPGCRAPARHIDQDHTVDHAHGGPTLDGNLGAACRHDHRLKGEGGWSLTQPEPGHFHWTSRLGHAYQTHPEPIIEPLPDPIPRDREPWPLIIPEDHDWETDQILEPPPPDPPPPPAPPHDPAKDPPPF